MRHKSAGILLLISVACCSQSVVLCEAQQRTNQKVFTDWGGVGHELVIDVFRGRLRIRKPRVSYVPTVYLVDGSEYNQDEEAIDANYKNHDIKQALGIKDGKLLYEGKPVTLPASLQMRNVWQAILWKGWVICLGRTSKTDGTAQLRPPFFATELITFNVEMRVARVRYVNFDPPSGTRLFILDPR